MIDLLRFMLRCCLSALIAWQSAIWLHLPHPFWAPMSALIVSQEELKTTNQAVLRRIAGTILGAVVALAVAEISGWWLHWSLTWQLMLCVAVCAACSKWRPALRVSLWTCALVLLTQSKDASAEQTALWRGTEVLIGAFVGGLAHMLDSRLHRKR